MKQEILNFLSNKKILIWGFGREGQSSLEFLRANLDAKDFTENIFVADQKVPEKTPENFLLEDDALQKLVFFDLILKSPGIRLPENFPESAKAKLNSQTELFLHFCLNTTIGITGTKGKSTTCSLINHILSKNNHHSKLVGNIGKPCFDIIDELRVDTIIVLELSCHQLEFAKSSPNIAILLNLYEEHLDHYRSADDYYDAKKNIFRFQNENNVLIFGDIFAHCSNEEIEHAPAGRKFDLNLEDTRNFPESPLKGAHNQLNLTAAFLACRELSLSETEIRSAIASFKNLAHRLEFVGNYQNIDFYDDSIATAQEATIAAVKALGNVDTLILGGMDRGLDYRKLVDFLRQSQVRNILLLPDTAGSLERLFSEEPYSQKLIFCATLEDAVKKAFKFTAENHSCLLSPAAASYNMFKNFEERGDYFQNLIKNHQK